MAAGKNGGGSAGGSLYFVVGNAWLFVALLLYVGRFPRRSSPTMYTFFSENSAWLTPVEYNGLMDRVCRGGGILFRTAFDPPSFNVSDNQPWDGRCLSQGRCLLHFGPLAQGRVAPGVQQRSRNPATMSQAKQRVAARALTSRRWRAARG